METTGQKQGDCCGDEQITQISDPEPVAKQPPEIETEPYHNTDPWKKAEYMLHIFFLPLKLWHWNF